MNEDDEFGFHSFVGVLLSSRVFQLLTVNGSSQT